MDAATSYTVELVDLQEQECAVVRGHVSLEEIGPFMGRAFGSVMTALARQGVAVAGAPFGRYFPAAEGGWDVEAGFPVHGAVAADGDVVASVLPAGSAARTLHVGDYGGLGAAYEATRRWIIENGHVPDGAPWECYLDGPEVANPRTEVFMPCHESRRP